MIIATAGHVDHGKTALVKRLTGVDTDRLEEEKRRGLSISLGFAYLPRGEHTPLGFIDVPGHQRFINNMISGVSGIDLGLLVVAADDGPMPQTREHLDVLRALGVSDVVAVLSKVDQVSDARRRAVEEELQTLLEKRGWDVARLFALSSKTGEGVDALKRYLLANSERASRPDASGCFRLSVDRAFTVKGAGVVVTGTASAGTVSVGDRLCLQPGGVEVRIRSLRVHDREADTARAGQRCALNLSGGVELADIARGDWLLSADAAAPARHIDVSFALLPGVPFPLKHLAPVKLYFGAGRIAGRIALLRTSTGARRLHAGDDCLARLILDKAIPCSVGQRFLLRDHAENVLLGGGTVLDPQAGIEKKASPERLAWLDAMRESTPAHALACLIAQGRLVNLSQFRLAWNLSPRDAIPCSQEEAEAFQFGGEDWVVSRARWAEVEAAVSSRVDDWHVEHPEEPGMKASVLRQALAATIDTPLLMAVLGAQLERGCLIMRDGYIRHANFNRVVPERQEATWQAVQSCLARSGNRVPLLSELVAQTGIPVPEFERVARDAVKNSRLFKVSAKRYALPGQLLGLSRDLIELYDAGEPLSVVTLKRCWGVGRNLAVEVLEYFDSIRFTRREGNVRVVMNAEVPAQLFSA